MEPSVANLTPFYFDVVEEKRINDVSEKVVDLITEKHLAYAEAVEVLERCKMLIQKKKII